MIPAENIRFNSIFFYPILRFSPGQVKPESMNGLKAVKKYANNGPVIAVCCALMGITQAICLVYSNPDRFLTFSVYFFGDTQNFLAHAQLLLQSSFRDSAPPFHPPGTAFVLAGWLKLIGDQATNVFVFKLLPMLFLGATIARAALLVHRMNGAVSAWITGILCAFSFGLAVIGSVTCSEIIYLPILLGTLLFIVPGGERSNRMNWIMLILAAVASALGWLVRGEHLLLIPVLAIYAAMAGDSWKSRRFVIRIVIFMVIVCAVITPWTLRNHRVMSQLNSNFSEYETHLPTVIPVTFYGPLNFALANLPPANGEFTREALPKSNGSTGLNLMDPVHREFIVNGYSKGFGALVNEPGRAVSLMIRNLDLATQGLGNGFTIRNVPGGWNGIRRPIDIYTPHATWFRWILILAAVPGLILLYKKNRSWAILVGVIIIHRLLIIMLFYGYARHGILLWPFLAILVGIGVAELIDRIPVKLRPALLVLVIAAGLSMNIGYAFHEKQVQVDYQADPVTGAPDQQLAMEFHVSD